MYNVSSQEIAAATNPVNSLSTIYNFLAVTPGVTTPIGSQPRIRGGQVTDLGYEFEGIPIQDDIVGFFTSNLSNVGLQNVEVYTGGLAGAGAVNGTGYFNSVLKSGTYPGFSSLGLQVSLAGSESVSFVRGRRGDARPQILVVRCLQRRKLDEPVRLRRIHVSGRRVLLRRPWNC